MLYFTSEQPSTLISFSQKSYAVSPEQFNADSPDCLIFRHPDNRKWFAIMMRVPAEKLGLSSGASVEILNIKLDPTLISLIVDGDKYFRAYHMNKEHWLTLILDGRVPTVEILALLDQSYHLTINKKGAAYAKA